jgi:hypothetical protein
MTAAEQARNQRGSRRLISSAPVIETAIAYHPPRGANQKNAHRWSRQTRDCGLHNEAFDRAMNVWPMETDNDIRQRRHCVFHMHIHAVLMAKYRRKLFDQEAIAAPTIGTNLYRP